MTHWLLALSLLAAEIRHGLSAEPVPFQELVADLSTRDVVFLGEIHDNSEFHLFQLEVLQSLHSLRPDLVLSMEMFERDAQGLVTDYLRGRIDEATFLEHSRPWKNYREHYRPLVEFAREHQLDVIAGNVPRRLAARRAAGDEHPFPPGPYRARSTSAPPGPYRDGFHEAVKDHVGADQGEAIDRMFAAQCLKDDTMAESMADYLEAHVHRRPLVVHLCGRFHSDFGLGTVARLIRRNPAVQVGLVSAIVVSEEEPFDFSEDRGRAHYLVLVPPTEKDEADASAEAESGETLP